MNHSFDRPRDGGPRRFPNSPRPINPVLPEPPDEAGWVEYLLPRIAHADYRSIYEQVRHARRRLLPNPALESRIANALLRAVRIPPDSSDPDQNTEWAVWLVQQTSNSEEWYPLLAQTRPSGYRGTSSFEEDLRERIIFHAFHILELRNLPLHGAEAREFDFVPAALPARYRQRRMDRMATTLFAVHENRELQTLLQGIPEHIGAIFQPLLDVVLRSEAYADQGEMFQAMLDHVRDHMAARLPGGRRQADSMQVRVRMYADANDATGMTAGIASSTRMMRLGRLNQDHMFTALRPVMNSNSNLTPIDFRYEFEFFPIDFQHGGSGAPPGKRRKKELPKHLEGLRGFVYYKANDGFCAARAILLALSTDRQRGHYLDGDHPSRGRKFAADARALGLPENVSIPEFSSWFVRRYPDKRLVLLNELAGIIAGGTHEGEEWHMPEGHHRRDEPNTIYIMFDLYERHFSYIKSINEFVKPTHEGTRFWCHGCLCLRREPGFQRHLCVVSKCPACFYIFENPSALQQHRERDESGTSHYCMKGNCRANFPNESCRNNHMLHCPGIPSQCPECNARLSATHNHQCGERTCALCHAFVAPDEEHACWLEKPKDDDPTAKYEHYAFDFESMACPRTITIGVGSRKRDQLVYDQVVNYAAVQKLHSGERWQFTTVGEFCIWALRQTNSSFWAHNLKGYDGRLVYDFYTRKYGLGPKKIVWCGSKIMMMTFKSTKFLDSYCHVDAPLAAMPKIFGLDPSMVKGDFPHAFNRPENQTYRGPLPSLSEFRVDRKKPAERSRIMEWHSGFSGVWDFQEQLAAYCIQDTHVLATCLEAYQKESLDLIGLDPLRCVTKASFAMKVYKVKHMPENTIAVLTQDQAAFCRRALRGGRTDVRCLYRKYEPEQMALGFGARYVDVQSLYPSAQFWQTMPIGHPIDYEYTVENQPDYEFLTNFVGFIECDVEVVKPLFHPALCAWDHGKLLATLKDQRRQCYTSVDLHAALLETDGAYRIPHVYRILAFEGTTDLFKDYIRTFLKVKIENGGMPSHVRADDHEGWAEYARHHREVIGIELDRSAMTKNAGRKQLAKLMLNSLWGKFGERDHSVETVTVGAAEYHEVMGREAAGEIELKRRQRLRNEDGTTNRMIVDFKSLLDKNEILAKTNVAIAAFVSAWGRRILWRELQKLGERVLYHDTDSIIYEIDPTPGAYNTPIGHYLGEWEDETSGAPIREFVSIGPKTYAYRLDGRPDAEGCVKAKGFTLTHNNAKVIHFEGLKQLIFDHNAKLKAEDFRMVYNQRDGGIFAMDTEKYLIFDYDKGMVDFDSKRTYPFGWERFHQNSLGDLEGYHP